MRYATLKDGALTPAPRTVTVGQTHYNPYPEDMLLADGYLPVVETSPPEAPEGFYPVSRYEEQEDKIVQLWALERVEVGE